jgi:glycosyltransferase involved in cell wall biosynthesis
MKIGVLIYNFQNGGAQNIFVKLANMFADYGHTVLLYVIDRNGPLIDKVGSNVNIVDLESNLVRRSLFPLMKGLLKHRPDYVLSTLLAPSILLILCNIILFRITKVVVSEASTPSLEPKNNIKVKSLYLLGRYVLPLCYKIISVSDGVKDDLEKYYKLRESKVVTIYNPVFSQNDNDEGNNVEKSGKYKVIFLGRIAPVKRIEIQIEAISILKKMGYKIEFNIVGNIVDKQYSQMLKDKIDILGISDDVMWIDYISDIKSILSQSDLFLLTSSYEGLPSALIEALHYGLQVIACDCEHGPREILDNGRLGQLIEYQNCTPAYLASRIKNSIDNPQDNIADDPHLLNFSTEKIYLQYLRLFNTQ